LATQKEVSISAACRQLGFTKQAYYKSLHNTRQKACVKAQAKLEVLSIRRHLPRLGTRKLHYLLSCSFTEHGVRIGRDALFTMLRDEHLLVGRKKRYTKTTNSKHWMRKYPDLVQGKVPSKPKQLWVADITYIAMEEGFSYLHLITDGYSKKIVGYQLSDDLSAQSSLQALKMAIGQSQCLPGLIHHSDRGLQYCSSAYTHLLESKKIAISMTQTGSPYDNAVAERINGILKDEFALDAVFTNKQQLARQLDQSIMSYNTLRPHTSNHMLTPAQMHQQNMLIPKTYRTKKPQEL
jgi:putative transposase